MLITDYPTATQVLLSAEEAKVVKIAAALNRNSRQLHRHQQTSLTRDEFVSLLLARRESRKIIANLKAKITAEETWSRFTYLLSQSTMTGSINPRAAMLVLDACLNIPNLAELMNAARKARAAALPARY